MALPTLSLLPSRLSRTSWSHSQGRAAKALSTYHQKGNCEPGQRADLTGCTPESGEATQGKEKPTRQEIGKGSTGKVYREGNKVIKSALLPSGKKSEEGKVYTALQGVQGIAGGQEQGNEIHTPYYKNILSVDAIEPKQRHNLAPRSFSGGKQKGLYYPYPSSRLGGG